MLDLALCHSIEEQLEINLSLCAVGLARSDDGIALQRRLGIEDIIHLGWRTIFEDIFLSNLRHRSIEQQLLRCKYQDMIQQALYIVNLMGRDDQRTILRHVLGYDLAELRL